MQWPEQRIILTGAGGGMGRLLAAELATRGCQLALLDANGEALEALLSQLEPQRVTGITVDLSQADTCEAAASQAQDFLGGVDMLINLAGMMSFRAYEDEDPYAIERLLHVNLLAPMWLTRAVLPAMRQQGHGAIINIGSIFGSIGFAHFTAYSTSKAGLRGFSEALRRELADTGIHVGYIAPRAVRTPMNDDRIQRMGEATGMHMDPPEQVVQTIIETIEQRRKERFIGFPESLFVRINALFPRIVDNALKKQNRIARSYAKGEAQ